MTKSRSRPAYANVVAAPFVAPPPGAEYEEVQDVGEYADYGGGVEYAEEPPRATLAMAGGGLRRASGAIYGWFANPGDTGISEVMNQWHNRLPSSFRLVLIVSGVLLAGLGILLNIKYMHSIPALNGADPSLAVTEISKSADDYSGLIGAGVCLFFLSIELVAFKLRGAPRWYRWFVTIALFGDFHINEQALRYGLHIKPDVTIDFAKGGWLIVMLAAGLVTLPAFFLTIAFGNGRRH